MNYDKLLNTWRKRAQRIVKMRDKGLTFSAIGAALKMTRQQAQSIYKRAKK